MIDTELVTTNHTLQIAHGQGLLKLCNQTVDYCKRNCPQKIMEGNQANCRVRILWMRHVDSLRELL